MSWESPGSNHGLGAPLAASKSISWGNEVRIGSSTEGFDKVPDTQFQHEYLPSTLVSGN